MAFYYSRKQKIERDQSKECVATFKGLVNPRILLEFKYHEKTIDLDSFKGIWDVFFAFVSGEIHFLHGIG